MFALQHVVNSLGSLSELVMICVISSVSCIMLHFRWYQTLHTMALLIYSSIAYITFSHIGLPVVDWNIR